MRNKLIAGAIFLVLIIAVSCARFDQYLTFEQFQANKLLLQQWVAAHPVLAPVLLALFYLVAVTCAIPTGGIATIVGGYFLGVPVATIAAVVGATLGACCTFLLARYVLRDLIEQRFQDKLHVLNHELAHHGLNYLFTIRLMPFTPFFILNPLLGLTRVSLATFCWTTAVGITPGTVLYAYAGRSLSQVHSLQELLWSWQALFAFFMLALMAVIPLLMRWRPPVRGE
jgi:uncharacterized membrane protein YdjX (TVP38/TMEM64 family)